MGESGKYGLILEQMKRILIAGGGPAGLMAAQQLAGEPCEVVILEANKAPGRKFLVAGNGGFNLSHAGELDQLVANYNRAQLRNAVGQFDNTATVRWLDEIGIPTYIGSSGKIFPEKGIKPIEVLNAWLQYLKAKGIQLLTEHRLLGWQDSNALIEHKGTVENRPFDYLVLAMGGASWKKTGSDGRWAEWLQKLGLQLLPFQASNAGMIVRNWSPTGEGTILKNVQLNLGASSEFGEVLLTSYGIEGAPVYALSHEVRNGKNKLTIDLKPHNTVDEVQQRLSKQKGNRRQQLGQMKLPVAVIRLLRDQLTKEAYLSDEVVAQTIKELPLEIEGLRPVEEAISTVGGVDMLEIGGRFELKNHPRIYCIGEMLDWDAPTGGYLLQGCFASGFVAGREIARQINLPEEG